MSPERLRLLVAIARNAIDESLGGGAVPLPNEPWLAEHGASFVTLRYPNRELHGCIGRIEATRAIGADVRDNAISAALYDPRSRPLTREAAEGMSVEVSVLSPLIPLDVSSEDEALRSIRPHIDGIVLSHARGRATFLPQVWGQLPEPKEYLGQLMLKAGLGRYRWTPDIRLSRYTSIHHTEPLALPS